MTMPDEEAASPPSGKSTHALRGESIQWIDAHCHLEPADFDDPGAVIARAREAGVVRAVIVGQLQKTGDFGAALEVAAANPSFLAPTMGIHPHDASQASEADWAELARICRLPQLAAVGEAGLDYHYDRSPRPVQREAFARQCALSLEVGKPLVVHVREAHDECGDILAFEKITRGVIHCFTGDLTAARRYLDLGFLISLSGVITYKKNVERLHEAVRFIPLDRMTVETDSPFLAPVPHRGRKNEPAYVVETGRKVAELKGCSVEEVAEATTRNASALYGFGL